VYSSYFLLVSLYLSQLTFFIGVLIYSLPIPFTGLKRWAPRLISDSIFVTSIALTLDMIFRFADTLINILGGSYDLANVFNTFISLPLILLMNIVFGYVKGVVPSALRPLVSPLSSLVSAAYTSLLTIVMLTLIIKQIRWFLATLGVLLMSIPFRIGRGAGAYILALSIVLYVGLPLFPLYVGAILQSSGEEIGVLMRFYDVYNRTLPDGYVLVELGGEKMIRKVDGGTTYISIKRELAQSAISVYFYVTGHRFYTDAMNITLADLCKENMLLTNLCTINITVYGLVYYRDGVAVHVFPYPDTISVYLYTYQYNTVLNSLLECSNYCEFYISIHEVYDLDEFYINGSRFDKTQLHSYAWSWSAFGNGATYYVELQPGKYNITASLIVRGNFTDIENEAYIELLQSYRSSQDNIISEIISIARLSVAIVFASLTYLSILLATAYGLARALGGVRVRLIP